MKKILLFLFGIVFLLAWRVDYGGKTILKLENSGDLYTYGNLYTQYINSYQVDVFSDTYIFDTPDDDTNVTLDVNISDVLPVDLNVYYKTYALSALYPGDFTYKEDNVTILAGKLGATFDIEIKSDGNTSQNRAFIIQFFLKGNDRKYVKNIRNATVSIRKKDDSSSSDDDGGGNNYFPRF